MTAARHKRPGHERKHETQQTELIELGNRLFIDSGGEVYRRVGMTAEVGDRMGHISCIRKHDPAGIEIRKRWAAWLFDGATPATENARQ